MPKKSATIRSVTDPVLPMDQIKKMSQKEACARFAERATVSQRAFAEMGKLHHAISASLKKGQTIYGELRKLGVKDSTISNASYASKMIDLVSAGHITEATYDTFTFADCLTISRVMGDKSRRKLSGEEVAAVMAAQPETFDAEFESIFTTGLTVEEAVAQAERARKLDVVHSIQDEINRVLGDLEEVMDELPEETCAQIVIPPVDEESLEEGVWRAHLEVVKALVTKAVDLRAEARAAAAAVTAQAPAPAPVPAPITVETAAPVGEDTDPGESGEEQSGEEQEPTEEVEPAEPSPAPAPAPVEESPAPTPTNVEQMPADPDRNLLGVLAALDHVPTDIAGMTTEAKKAVFAKLAEVQQAIADMLSQEVQQAA